MHTYVTTRTTRTVLVLVIHRRQATGLRMSADSSPLFQAFCLSTPICCFDSLERIMLLHYSKRMPLQVPEGNGEYKPHQRRKQQGSSASLGSYECIPLSAGYYSSSTTTSSHTVSSSTAKRSPLLTSRKNHGNGLTPTSTPYRSSFPTYSTPTPNGSAGWTNNHHGRRRKRNNIICSRIIMDCTNNNIPTSSYSIVPRLCFFMLVAFTLYQTIPWIITTVSLPGLRRIRSDFPLSINSDPPESITFLYPEYTTTSTTITVPKRWFPPNWGQKQQSKQHPQQQFSKRIASSIGTYYIPSRRNAAPRYLSTFSSATYTESNSWDRRTIFVGISTYQSLHCPSTIEHIFSTALYPDRIRVGVVDYTDEKDIISSSSCNIPSVPCNDQPNQVLCQYTKNVDVFQFHHPPNFMVGPSLVGHIVQRLYRGEYYVLLTSINTVMVSGWDVEAIHQLESLNNEMAVLSTIPPVANERNLNRTTWQALRNTRVVLCDADFFGETFATRVFTLLEEDQPEIVSPPSSRGSGITSDTTPKLQPYWSSHFSFSRGHFILNVPYDPYLSFAPVGEDLSISIRAFTHGYDVYTPERPLSFSFETNFNRHRYDKKKAVKFPR